VCSLFTKFLFFCRSRRGSRTGGWKTSGSSARRTTTVSSGCPPAASTSPSWRHSGSARRRSIFRGRRRAHRARSFPTAPLMCRCVNKRGCRHLCLWACTRRTVHHTPTRHTCHVGMTSRVPRSWSTRVIPHTWTLHTQRIWTFPAKWNRRRTCTGTRLTIPFHVAQLSDGPPQPFTHPFRFSMDIRGMLWRQPFPPCQPFNMLDSDLSGIYVYSNVAIFVTFLYVCCTYYYLIFIMNHLLIIHMKWLLKRSAYEPMLIAV